MTADGRLRLVRSCLGSLVVVPLLILFTDFHWSIPRRDVTPLSLLLVDDSAPSRWETVELPFLAEGSPLYHRESLRSRRLEVALPEALPAFRVILQTEAGHAFHVAASSNGNRYSRLWYVPAQGGDGAIVQRSPLFEPEELVQFLRVTPVEGPGEFFVTGVGVVVPPLAIPQWWLVVFLWGLSGSLFVATRFSRVRPAAVRVLNGWSRIDLWLASILAFTVLFRLPGTLVVAGLALGGLLGALYAIKRVPLAAGGLLLVGLLVVVGLPAVLRALLLAKISEVHELTVDHRLRPDPNRGINSDGIRSREAASDFDESDFVVLFLGDSFTYGSLLDHEETYPQQFEGAVAGPECSAEVRAVNFGWPSSSPLLSFRLLREIGHKYQPDLVVYALDMTDFHDDLRYEARLREGGDLELDPFQAVERMVATRFPWLDLKLQFPTGFLKLSRFADAGGGAIPRDRYFATNQPLEASRTAIERGVMKNLERISDLSSKTLGSPMVVVIPPRAFQYSERESPDNWEKRAYPIMGSFVREPFRYFREVGPSLPYPVIDLLSAFENSEEFPLFQKDDPHWTPNGAGLVAREVAAGLVALGLVPCSQ